MEAAGDIEPFRVEIANHVQKAGGSRSSNVGDVLNESSADAAFPEVRFDEEGIQLCTAV
jgi:hypothetical protein